MRIRELLNSNVLIPLTNEEFSFLRKNRQEIIELSSLEPRDSRIAENLIFKEILCKINKNQATVNVNVYKKR